MARVYILRASSADTASVRLSISMHDSDSICAATPQLRSDLEIRLKIVAKKKVSTLGEAREIEG